jgi:type IV secretion system protein VirB10
VRISKRAAAALIGVIALVLLAFAYGGYRRTIKNEAAAREAGLPKSVAPATQAGTEFASAIPLGTAPVSKPTELQPPSGGKGPTANDCGIDARDGTPFRYNPQTGQPCGRPEQERVVIRQAPPVQPKQVEQHEPTAEEREAVLAYQREQEAMLAPTATSQVRSLESAHQPARSADVPQMPTSGLPEVLTRSQAATQLPADVARALNGSNDDYGLQNMQARKEAFLTAAADHRPDDYLRSVRSAPVSRFEVKAGWEIPAVLEQALNSDLPGELKALVTSNVYDTATGVYLLVPQGARLTGQYDSRVSYGQDGVQVAWNRIIFPDASTIDLNGMVGLDAHGNAGLRDQVDRHYRRLLGFSVLTSMFTASFAVSQQRNQSVLVNPSPGQIAAGSVGQELSQTGSQITRRNLNVQPTIKVPAGYRFTVRVNRDILFESPYEALAPRQ